MTLVCVSFLLWGRASHLCLLPHSAISLIALPLLNIRNMKNTIVINQKFALLLGLDIIDIALFDFVRAHLLAFPRGIEGTPLDTQWIVDEMPLLGLTRRSARIRLTNLEEKGLIRLYEAKNSLCVDMGENGRKYDFTDPTPIPHEEPQRKVKEGTPLEEREKHFKDECNLFAHIYTPKMVDEFFTYWSEPNKSRTKMRFEQEPTWEISRRLATWARRNNIRPIKNLSVSDALKNAYGK